MVVECWASVENEEPTGTSVEEAMTVIFQTFFVYFLHNYVCLSVCLVRYVFRPTLR